MAIGDVKSRERGSGARYNDGKVRMELLPPRALRETARVFQFGAEKYADWNWAKGMKWSVPYACAMRHLTAWYEGEEDDPESGLSHLAHAACNLAMLLQYEETYEEGDDRPEELRPPT